MNTHELIERLLHEDRQRIRALTKGCGSCRKFVHRLRKRPGLAVGWDDIPQEFLERFSSRLHQRLFDY